MFPHSLIQQIVEYHKDDSMVAIVQDMQRLGCDVSSFPPKGTRKHKLRKLNNGKAKECFDILNDYYQEGSIFWGILETSKHDTHMIAICDQWIFDSNYQHAMLLTQENLDLACDIFGTGQKFKQFKKLYIFNVRE